MKTPWKKVFVIITIVVSVCVLYHIYTLSDVRQRYKSSEPGQEINSEEEYRHTELVAFEDRSGIVTKTIQWFDVFHNGHGLRNRAHNIKMNKCEYSNCKILKPFIVHEGGGAATYGPMHADAIIFQGVHLGMLMPPQRQDENQVFVFAERETWWYVGSNERMMSPHLNKTEKHKPVKPQSTVPDVLEHSIKYQNTFRFLSLFNWTMTYRLDSDIPLRYGNILPKNPGLDVGLSTSAKHHTKTGHYYDQIYFNKTRDVVWLVSDCFTKSKRELYVQRLKEFINVDIYGACGTLSCPKKTSPNSVKENCIKKIIKEYKFVLSFENTFHTDYATEKLYDWFPRNIIQVVYGMADYSSITPHKTVINAADFSSPEKLAKYMKRVGSVKDKYIRYLQTKDNYLSVGHDEMQQKAYCQLCEKLHNLARNRRSYPNIEQWWKLNDSSPFRNLQDQAFGRYDTNSRFYLTNYRFLEPLFYLVSAVVCGACLFATCGYFKGRHK